MTICGTVIAGLAGRTAALGNDGCRLNYSVVRALRQQDAKFWRSDFIVGALLLSAHRGRVKRYSLPTTGDNKAAGNTLFRQDVVAGDERRMFILCSKCGSNMGYAVISGMKNAG